MNHIRGFRVLDRSDIFLCLAFCLLTITCPVLAQWTRIGGPYSGAVTGFAVTPVAGGTYIFAAVDPGGVIRSTNNGKMWVAVNYGLKDLYVAAITACPNGNGSTYLMAATGNGVFRSTNNGTKWAQVNAGLTDTTVWAFAVAPSRGGGTDIFAGTGGTPWQPAGNAFLSPDFGTSWTAISTGLPNTPIGPFAASPAVGKPGTTNIYAGTGEGVYLFSYDDSSWADMNSGLTDLNILAFGVFADSSGKLLVGTYGGAFLSNDDATSWTQVNNGLTDSTACEVYCFAFSGSNIFAGVGPGGVFLSTNNGTQWTNVDTGLTDPSVFALAVIGTDLFAGTMSYSGRGGIWKRPLSEMITSVPSKGGSTNLPTHFSLEQNYPNPFNPKTTIRFSLPQSNYVTMKVFNLLGQEVARLVSAGLSAGTHTTEWNAGKMESGVYFYRIRAGTFSDVKEMILLK